MVYFLLAFKKHRQRLPKTASNQVLMWNMIQKSETPNQLRRKDTWSLILELEKWSWKRAEPNLATASARIMNHLKEIALMILWVLASLLVLSLKKMDQVRKLPGLKELIKLCSLLSKTHTCQTKILWWNLT